MIVNIKRETYYNCKNCGEISIYDTLHWNCIYCGGSVEKCFREIIQTTESFELYRVGCFNTESNSYRDILKKELFYKNNFKEKK